MVNSPAAARLIQNTFGSEDLFENVMYDGVLEFLAEQSAANKRLFIASTKPYVYTSRILKHFEISQFFEGVYGSELDGTLSIKSDLLRYIFSRQIFNTDETVMIGDRIQDVEAAKSVGVCPIWVDYDYGDQSERDIAKSDYICGSINELRKLINMI